MKSKMFLTLLLLVTTISINGFATSPAYPLDADGDGFVFWQDNCPNIYNPAQANIDEDEFGDDCDACSNDFQNDVDDDGFCGDVDNCPNTSNPDQYDYDDDGVGRECDSDDVIDWPCIPEVTYVNGLSCDDGTCATLEEEEETASETSAEVEEKETPEVEESTAVNEVEFVFSNSSAKKNSVSVEMLAACNSNPLVSACCAPEPIPVVTPNSSAVSISYGFEIWNIFGDNCVHKYFTNPGLNMQHTGGYLFCDW